jgi:type IV pilus assembly protein PilB
VQVLYREWQPPPQPMVDEQGNPIETPICPQCSGIGYFQRTGLFELLEVSDTLKETLVKQPQLDVLTKIAREGGHRTLQDEGILSVCFGTTSLTEMQRVLKQ